jgi:hypothetical protein
MSYFHPAIFFAFNQAPGSTTIMACANITNPGKEYNLLNLTKNFIKTLLAVDFFPFFIILESNILAKFILLSKRIFNCWAKEVYKRYFVNSYVFSLDLKNKKKLVINVRVGIYKPLAIFLLIIVNFSKNQFNTGQSRISVVRIK